MPSLYDISVPVFIAALRRLDRQLDIATDWASQRGLPESTLTEARLIADMGDLVFQVQRASDAAKGTVARVGGLAPAAMADGEVTIADLKRRIAATIALLEATAVSVFEGKDDAEVVLALPTRTLTFTGLGYVLEFALPNFFFHVTTAYALLRMKGVPVGKIDFLWSPGV